MTEYDIKSYLEKIYNVKVVRVRTNILSGEIVRDEMKGYLKKKDDYKMAYVWMPKDCTFEIPNLYPDDQKQEKQLQEYEMRMKEFKKQNALDERRCDVPSWFNI